MFELFPIYEFPAVVLLRSAPRKLTVEKRRRRRENNKLFFSSFSVMERQSIVQHQDPGIELNNRYGSVSYFIFVITEKGSY